MEEIVMSKKESNEFRIVNDFMLGKITRKHASELLNVTERTITRKAVKIGNMGLLGIKHGNTGKVAHNKTDEKLKIEVMEVVHELYYDFNLTHMHEKLYYEHLYPISYDCLRRWCHEANLVKRKQKRRSKPRHCRQRMSKPGLMLQMDGSHHFYVSCKQWVLVAGIDDSSSEVPYGEFFPAETTQSYFTVLEQIIKTKGIPYSIYVDRAGCLGGAKRVEFGQFVRACDELGIHVIFANSPQGKGRIERFWQVVQDRIVPEFRLHKVSTVKQANYYFNKVFLQNYWNEEKTIKATAEAAYRPLETKHDLKEIFCFKYTRKINNDHTVLWKNQVYQLHTKENLAKQTVEVREYPDQTISFYFAKRPINATKLPKKQEVAI